MESSLRQRLLSFNAAVEVSHSELSSNCPPFVKVMGISVVIRATNKEKFLLECLRYLALQHRPIDEIIVGDTSSTNQTAARAKGFGRTESLVSNSAAFGNWCTLKQSRNWLQ